MKKELKTSDERPVLISCGIDQSLLAFGRTDVVRVNRTVMGSMPDQSPRALSRHHQWMSSWYRSASKGLMQPVADTGRSRRRLHRHSIVNMA